MKQTRIIMDMPVTLEIVDDFVPTDIFDNIFSYFEYIDNKFSVFKKNSEITLINKGKIKKSKFSNDIKTIFELANQTKKQTGGYFDILHKGIIDPSGIVKGWAIHQASRLIGKAGYKNYYVEAGGDIETRGVNSKKLPWRIGIRNPFKKNEIVKVLYIKDKGVATSGTYERGLHIYNPKNKNKIIDEIVSLTVIGPNIYEADRFATAAFAMGKYGIEFIEKLVGFEGYMIDKDGIATSTTGFYKYSQTK